MSDDKQKNNPAPESKSHGKAPKPQHKPAPDPNQQGIKTTVDMTEKDQPNVQSEETSKTEDQNDAAQPGENVHPIHGEENTSEGEGGGDSPDEAATTQEADPVALLEAELAALKDKVLRTNADMENLRRRTEREKQDMAKFAISNFAKDIISVDDNLNRALEAVPEGAVENDAALKALVDGVGMTGRELANVFERNGITRIDPKGEIFDPNAHQAMFEMPNPEVPAGTILEVVATGFSIEGRILRPAMVGIAKGGEKPKKDNDKPAEPTTGEENKAGADNPDASPEGQPGENIDKAV